MSNKNKTPPPLPSYLAHAQKVILIGLGSYAIATAYDFCQNVPEVIKSINARSKELHHQNSVQQDSLLFEQHRNIIEFTTSSPQISPSP